MEKKHIGTLSIIVGILGFVIQYVPPLIIGRWVEGGFEGVIPMIGTTGQTVTAYNLLSNITQPLLILALAVGFGYSVAQHVDMTYEYRGFALTVAIGSIVGVVFTGVLLSFETTVTSVDGFTVFLLLASFGSMIASVVPVITVGAFAGAALSHFQISDNTPRSAERSTGSSSGTLSESTDENSHTQSQPTR